VITAANAAAVRDVLATVDDPEYPGISIVDLGLVADVRVGDEGVEVDLIPTFSGCPALDLIAADARAALVTAGYDDAEVRFVESPVWSSERISASARGALAERFTVAVGVTGRPVRCPRCGGGPVIETSMFGPTRCRSIARCDSCGEHLEVIRS
jgi:ring-1,2-phenylacetyl-CoA epoxidase subunit PaaD